MGDDTGELEAGDADKSRSRRKARATKVRGGGRARGKTASSRGKSQDTGGTRSNRRQRSASRSASRSRGKLATKRSTSDVSSEGASRKRMKTKAKTPQVRLRCDSSCVGAGLELSSSDLELRGQVLAKSRFTAKVRGLCLCSCATALVTSFLSVSGPLSPKPTTTPRVASSQEFEARRVGPHPGLLDQ